MKRLALILCLTLAACQEKAAQDTAPVPLDPHAIGHYCQMELLEHEGPKAQVHLEGLPGAPLFFSQVRDVVAYSRMPEQSHVILATWVNDMGAAGATWADPGINNWIKAEDAVYVVGAAIEGGMGAPELVPFLDPASAKAFTEIHGGVVMRLDQIPDDAVLTPVAIDADTPEADSEFEQRLRALSRKTGG